MGALLLVGIAAVASHSGGVASMFDYAWLHRQQSSLVDLYRVHPVAATCALFCVYTAIAALALPGASLLMLAAGASHGLIAGTLLCLTACTLGSTLTMLGSRHLLRGPIERRFRRRLASIDAGLAEEGALYLFSLRMVPVVPFVLVNLLFGLTAMKTRTFVSVSFVGMLAGTAVYVNAGRALAHVGSVAELLSPGLLAALLAIGLLPLLVRRLFACRRVRRTVGA